MDTLTIYPSFAHVISTSDQLETPLPASIDPSSIIVFKYDTPAPFTFYPSMSATLTNSHATVTKNGSTYEGEIISQESNSVSLRTSTGITVIRNYDLLSVPSPPKLRHHPYIVAATQSRISYLRSDISWNCKAQLWIAGDAGLLRLTAHITNSGPPVQSNVSLISGKINTVKPKYMMRAVVADATPEPEQLEDYIKFSVGPVTIREISIVQLATASVSVAKVYLHRTNENGVEYGYRFLAPTVIPACTVDTYSDMDYLGTSTIPESRSEQPVTVIVGGSTVITCNTTMEQREIEKKKSETRINTEITNTQSESTLILRHYVGNQHVESISCDVPMTRKDGYLEWMFNVPPGMSVFACTILSLQ